MKPLQCGSRPHVSTSSVTLDRYDHLTVGSMPLDWSTSLPFPCPFPGCPFSPVTTFRLNLSYSTKTSQFTRHTDLSYLSYPSSPSAPPIILDLVLSESLVPTLVPERRFGGLPTFESSVDQSRYEVLPVEPTSHLPTDLRPHNFVRQDVIPPGTLSFLLVQFSKNSSGVSYQCRVPLSFLLKSTTSPQTEPMNPPQKDSTFSS